MGSLTEGNSNARLGWKLGRRISRSLKERIRLRSVLDRWYMIVEGSITRSGESFQKVREAAGRPIGP